MSESTGPARLVIAAAHSGSGKTTICAGLIAALAARGLRVQPFKAGPDYIDPSYHTLAAGRPCRNLDSWMIGPEAVRESFERNARQADVAVVEGVMGLFDGATYDDESGSTAEVAKRLDAPVVVVLDAAKMARSAGAVALGLLKFDPQVRIAGFLANRVGSPAHGRGVAQAITAATGRPCFGWLPREAALAIPERHLGLVPTAEPGRWRAFIEEARAAVERHVDVEALLALAGAGPAASTATPSRPAQAAPRAGPVIAVARDEAFSFIYPENLELLEEAGGQIAYFSPLRDRALPPGAAGIILSGGFPEIYAAQLSANTEMLAALRRAHRDNLPIYAECGGLMLLTEAIEDLDGQSWPMAGLLPGRSVMSNRVALGYRLAQAQADGPVLAAGEQVRGHEFHYSQWASKGLPPAYSLLPLDSKAAEPEPHGARLGNLWASYIHLHFLARPDMANRFVAWCAGREA